MTNYIIQEEINNIQVARCCARLLQHRRPQMLGIRAARAYAVTEEKVHNN